MQVNALRDMPSYARHLQSHPEETPALLADMLIGVTNFFRDREAFEALERDIIPALFEQKRDLEDRSLRVWAAACSTGEEAYSLAMLLADQAEISGAKGEIQSQVFATDIDDRALARWHLPRSHRDRCAAGAAAAVLRQGAEPLPQKALRERILFSAQHSARSAVFQARPDFLPHLMIYLDRDIQIEVLRMFFALNPGATCSSAVGNCRCLRPIIHAGGQEEPYLPRQGGIVLTATHLCRALSGLYLERPQPSSIQRTVQA
ncbi:CheR family methyltransferase [Stutzerimonas zhaodongensis]|uniref:CheR family methyltransferase n=1 Tax=Stutzerimonas zhaodongensis TaxID=1176257 RepID=UPI0020A63B2B|nr:CheR family methyltransferase [Stutzerimonas zhaodongensis]